MKSIRFSSSAFAVGLTMALSLFAAGCGSSGLPLPEFFPSKTPTATVTPPPTLTPTPLPPLGFYFVDAFEPHYAKIYKMENGQVSVFFNRARGGQIYSFAFGPDGTLYLVDANSFRLAKIVNGRETRFFTHTTYIRFVAFDSKGNLYFSEDSGAGGDAKIYRLDGTKATLFYTIKLSDVDGFCCGGFAFDKDDNLWISNGNVVPASLYKVVDGTPQKVLTLDSESLYGFYFDSYGNLVIANWQTNVYRYAAPDFTSRETFTVPDAMHVSGVAPIKP